MSEKKSILHDAAVYERWVESLKAGDAVAIVSSHAFYAPSVRDETVERVTTSQVIVGRDSRFRRIGRGVGEPVGSGRGHGLGSSNLVPRDDPRTVEIRERNAKHALRGKVAEYVAACEDLAALRLAVHALRGKGPRLDEVLRDLVGENCQSHAEYENGCSTCDAVALVAVARAPVTR